MKESYKPYSHKITKLRIIYFCSNNARQPLTKTFTRLHYTSPNYTSLFYPNKTDKSVTVHFIKTEARYNVQTLCIPGILTPLSHSGFIKPNLLNPILI
jgi:hypothetical protein